MTLASVPSARFQLCGPMVLELEGERLERRLPGRQGRLLLAYLLLKRNRPVQRDELYEALWPGEPPPAIERALNSLVSKLRKVVGAERLQGRSSLRLLLDHDAWIDTEVADECAHRAESRIALEDWTGAWGPGLAALFIAERDFLAGESAPWIDEQRRHLDEVRLRSLEAYATAALGIGGTELPAAVRAGQQLVRLVPLRETGYQVLMRALARQGNAAEGLRVYTELCTVLRDEIGGVPCAATQAVYEDLLRA